MVKSIDGKLLPNEEAAERYLRRIKAGDPVLLKITQPRNAKFHRKYFALLDLAFDNQDRYEDREALRKEIIMRAGFWHEHVHLTGGVSYTAKSISWAKMDDLEFADLYQKSIDVIIKYFMPDTDPDALASAVDEVLSFA